jgi:hypothetical protein
VIQLAVPGPRQPVSDDRAAGGLQRAVPVWAAQWCLLSYLLGAVILAATINLVAGRLR